MDIRTLEHIYAYNYWARDKILTQARKLNKNEWLEKRVGDWGSMRNTLAHTLTAEWVWRLRLQERLSPTQLLDFEAYPDVDSLAAHWQEEQTRMLGYIHSLTPEALEERVHYQRSGGQPADNLVWHLLVHVVNHGTEHRTQAALALTECGHSPGDIDMVHYLWELT